MLTGHSVSDLKGYISAWVTGQITPGDTQAGSASGSFAYQSLGLKMSGNFGSNGALISSAQAELSGFMTSVQGVALDSGIKGSLTSFSRGGLGSTLSSSAALALFQYLASPACSSDTEMKGTVLMWISYGISSQSSAAGESGSAGAQGSTTGCSSASSGSVQGSNEQGSVSGSTPSSTSSTGKITGSGSSSGSQPFSGSGSSAKSGSIPSVGSVPSSALPTAASPSVPSFGSGSASSGSTSGVPVTGSASSLSPSIPSSSGIPSFGTGYPNETCGCEDDKN